MKTKRRHELQTNQLADWIGHKVQAIKSYRLHILGIVVSIVLVVGTIMVVTLQSRGVTEEAWRSFTVTAVKDRPSGKDFEEVRDDPDAVLWAQQLAGDTLLRSGAVDMYVKRTKAKDDLTKASSLFQDVIARADNKPMLMRRGMFGLAQTFECLGALGGDKKISASDYLKQAKEQYKKLAEQAPNTALGKAAAHRHKRLEDSHVISFYNEFASYSPKPENATDDTVAPLPPVPDLSFPGDDMPLPDAPDISFPELAILDDKPIGGGEFTPTEAKGDPTSTKNDKGGDASNDKPKTNQPAPKDDGTPSKDAAPKSLDDATPPSKKPDNVSPPPDKPSK